MTARLEPIVLAGQSALARSGTDARDQRLPSLSRDRAWWGRGGGARQPSVVRPGKRRVAGRSTCWDGPKPVRSHPRGACLCGLHRACSAPWRRGRGLRHPPGVERPRSQWRTCPPRTAAAASPVAAPPVGYVRFRKAVARVGPVDVQEAGTVTGAPDRGSACRGSPPPGQHGAGALTQCELQVLQPCAAPAVDHSISLRPLPVVTEAATPSTSMPSVPSRGHEETARQAVSSSRPGADRNR